MSMIVMNDFKKQWEEIHPQFIEAVTTVGSSGYLILGPQVQSFEKELASYWGLNKAIGCANGMDALEISLRAMDIKTGDKVLTTPLSAFATTLAILKTGAIPVFIDVDKNGLVDLDLAEQVFAKNPDIKFFIPVHLYGHCLNLEKLKELKNKFSLKIIEDCAQSIGAKYKQIPCGSVGQFAATSFYPTKNLGCYGDGGALLTNDTGLYEKAFQIRDYGQSQKYVHSEIGLNSRLDELQACILNKALLPRLNQWTENRKQIAKQYLLKIKNKNMTLPTPIENSDSVWHLFPLIIESNRDQFISYLKENGVASGVHYPILIPNQPVFNKHKTSLQYQIIGSLNHAEQFANSEVSLPIHPYLTNDEVEKVIRICNQWNN